MNLFSIKGTGLGATNDPFADLDNSEGWMTLGICAQTDPGLFFPEGASGPPTRAAIDVCNSCPVQRQCLRYAVDHPELVGVWGGTTQRQRNQMRKAAKEVA